MASGFKTWLVLVVAALAAACATLYAQSPTTPAPDPQPRRMVILNVRVTDSAGHAVVDVNQDGFTVTEDGVTQKITYFSKAEVPLSYGLVIDNSASMRRLLDAVVQTGAKIVNSNKGDDETFLVRFISSDKIETVVDFSSNKLLLQDRLNNLFVEGGQTALIDALYLSAQKLVGRKAENSLRRQALILITDGEERSSFYKQAQLFELLSANDIQIYVVGFTNQLDGKSKTRAIELLSRLANDTGGRIFFPQTPLGLADVADEVVRDIRNQYTVGYVPSGTGPENSFHKVLVSIANNPAQEKRIAVTRVGYAAPGKK